METQKKIFILLGIWLVVDGIASIVEYWYQSLFEHSIRTIRTAIGFYLIYKGKS